jgi:nucleotide-binding universal stress UspA family protein
MTIIAAVDDSAAARPVLEVAARLASLLGSTVEAVHVQEDGSGQSVAAICAAAGIPLHVRTGNVGAALGAEVRTRDAGALVIGIRGLPAGTTPAGHVALDLIQSLDVTIVVVPPDASDRPLRRVLVAVEGDGESPGLRGLFDHLGDRPTPEVIALHVTEPADLPLFADSPVLEADAFEREFRMRVASTVLDDPSRVQFEMRIGDAAEALRDATEELDADLVVLAWRRDLSGGHGRLVREMLTSSPVPVALLPRVQP